jgi:hypothetical protein
MEDFEGIRIYHSEFATNLKHWMTAEEEAFRKAASFSFSFVRFKIYITLTITNFTSMQIKSGFTTALE